MTGACRICKQLIAGDVPRLVTAERAKKEYRGLAARYYVHLMQAASAPGPHQKEHEAALMRVLDGSGEVGTFLGSFLLEVADTRFSPEREAMRERLLEQIRKAGARPEPAAAAVPGPELPPAA